MSVNLTTMQICGNILSTKNYNFFALRCVECHTVFGQWSSFIKHLIKSHSCGGNADPSIKGEWNSDEECLDDETSPYGAQCNYKKYEVDKQEEEEVSLLADEADVLNEDFEFHDEHSDDENASPKAKQTYADEKDEVDAVCASKKPTNDHIKQKRAFHFSLTDSEYKSISRKFLKLLQKQPLLWDENHADFRKPYVRTKALIQIKLELKKFGYTASDAVLRRTIPRILSQFKEAKQELATNGVVDTQTHFFLDECQFLGSLIDASDGEEDDDEKDDDFGKESGTDDNSVDSDFEPSTSKTVKKVSKKENDPNAPTYTLVSSKNKHKYKRIRFHLVDSKIAVDFINMVRDNPVLWDSSLPNFNRIHDRKTIMKNWITLFEQQHNELFTYDDFALNLVELRRYYSKLLRRKVLDDTAKTMLEMLKFMPVRTRKEKMKCEHCDKLFLSKINYQGHLFKEHKIGESPFKCEECNKQFVNGTSRLLHMKQVHFKKFDYACTMCDRSFLQPSNLEMHMAVHTGQKRFICETCGKGFRRRINLTYHETRIHLRQRNFPCQMCPKAFYTKALLRDHINSHLNIRNFKCPFCGKAFHSSHALMRHKQIHSEIKRYACKMCDARFNQFVGLNAHMKSRHQFVQEKNQTETSVGAAVDDYDEHTSSQESMEVKRMDEYVYNFDYEKN